MSILWTQPGSSGATRWVMRSSNGSLWATGAYYTPAEVETFQCAKPVKPLLGIASHLVPMGTLRDVDRMGLSI